MRYSNRTHPQRPSDWLAVGLLLLSRRPALPHCGKSAPSVFFARPAHTVDGTAHGACTHLHTMGLLPQAAVLFQDHIGVCLQLGDQTRVPRGIFLGGSPRNRLGQHISRLSSMLEVAFECRQGDVKHVHNLSAGFPLIHRSRDFFSQILGIGFHAFILSPGSFLPPAAVSQENTCMDSFIEPPLLSPPALRPGEERSVPCLGQGTRDSVQGARDASSTVRPSRACNP